MAALQGCSTRGLGCHSGLVCPTGGTDRIFACGALGAVEALRRPESRWASGKAMLKFGTCHAHGRS